MPSETAMARAPCLVVGRACSPWTWHWRRRRHDPCSRADRAVGRRHGVGIRSPESPVASAARLRGPASWPFSLLLSCPSRPAYPRASPQAC
eukprot:7471796-Pyramimonas_sp.AAC.1